VHFGLKMLTKNNLRAVHEIAQNSGVSIEKLHIAKWKQISMGVPAPIIFPMGARVAKHPLHGVGGYASGECILDWIHVVPNKCYHCRPRVNRSCQSVLKDTQGPRTCHAM